MLRSSFGLLPTLLVLCTVSFSISSCDSTGPNEEPGVSINFELDPNESNLNINYQGDRNKPTRKGKLVTVRCEKNPCDDDNPRLVFESVKLEGEHKGEEYSIAVSPHVKLDPFFESGSVRQYPMQVREECNEVWRDHPWRVTITYDEMYEDGPTEQIDALRSTLEEFSQKLCH